MNEPPQKASETLLTSFSVHVLAGEALCYPQSTHTPTGGTAFEVNVATKPIDSGVIQAWFIQSVKPLVGATAADTLAKLIKDKPGEFKAFLEQAIKFRRSLK
ncbi:MAG: hypothetical protein ABSF95_02255 [Verrucomicrobiota bacterium]|jgi:hypothetical protein